MNIKIKGGEKMSTREENLKKINEELEKLDDEQLEEIAGGKHIMYPPRPAKFNDVEGATVIRRPDRNQ